MKNQKSKKFISFVLALTMTLALIPVPSVLAAKEKETHYMAWEFIIYEEPDFTAKQIGTFPPQAVTVTERREDGWALISTYKGFYWIYLTENKRYISTRMFLHNTKNDREAISSIEPQVVSILDQDGNWLQISTWRGPKWVNLFVEFPKDTLDNFISQQPTTHTPNNSAKKHKELPPPNILDDFMKKYNNEFSVYYENIETGYCYTYNADKVYWSASVVKAPYALYVYSLAEQGKADLDSVHTYKSGDYMSGTGIIKNMRAGSTFTEHELLKYNIRNSDNIAFRMLINKYGTAAYKDFVSNLGGNSDYIKSVMMANMTAKEAGLFAKSIYNYIESDGKYSKQFKKDLMSTTNPMIVSDYPVARKYGWAKDTFHDLAIVYADSPYILVIMSAKGAGTASDFKAFRDISLFIQGFNDKHFK